MNDVARGTFSSRLGFILAAAGSAVGLGNIWRFPYLTGENGGAAFVVVYLLCVLLMGVPVLVAELSLGRHTGLNPVGAIRAVTGSRYWPLVGYLGVATGVGILSYYAVIAGWTLGYTYRAVVGTVGEFSDFVANPVVEIGYFSAFVILTAGVVLGGVKSGIERWSMVLMPLLFVLLIGLVIFSLTLDGAAKGVEFYLFPDLTEVTFGTVLAALGQAFFSLSLGMGTMITYGSYLQKQNNLPSAAVSVALADAVVAVLAGLVVFPALFSVGMAPSAGPGLVFGVFPKIFAMMPAGRVVGIAFFVLLSIAALTSTVSLLEVPVAFLVDQRRWSRTRAVVVVSILVFVVGLPSALSQGSVEALSHIDLLGGKDFLSVMDLAFGNLSLTLGGLLICIIVGWRWGVGRAAEEALAGTPAWYARALPLWSLLVRFVCPAVIFVVLLNLTGLFD